MLIIIILVLLLCGGGWYGVNAGYYGYAPFGGVLGLVLLIIILYWLLGGHHSL